MAFYNSIPTNIITGFLGVGKTTTILNLLKQKPESEKWAVLVNEFGEIGLDGALIESEMNNSEQIAIREVPGGCMCCTSGLPMQIALNMLIMKAKPDRLLIEPTGLGHPEEVIKVLSGEHYQEVLALNNTVTIVDARHFTKPEYLRNTTFQQQLSVADLLVVNKSDLATENDNSTFERYLSENTNLSHKNYIHIQHGELDLAYLYNKPRFSETFSKTSSPLIPKKDDTHHNHKHVHEHKHKHNHEHDHGSSEYIEPDLPACGYLVKTHSEDEFTSVGWRINEQRKFDLRSLVSWMQSLHASRIKALIQCEQGYASFNLNAEDESNTREKIDFIDTLKIKQSSGENRIEMIFHNTLITDDHIREWTNYLC